MTITDDREMPCRELVQLVSDYFEDRLDATERARFEAHIGECSYCATYLEQMRQTIRTLGHLPEESLSPEARAAMVEALRGWHRGA